MACGPLAALHACGAGSLRMRATCVFPLHYSCSIPSIFELFSSVCVCVRLLTSRPSFVPLRFPVSRSGLSVGAARCGELHDSCIPCHHASLLCMRCIQPAMNERTRHEADTTMRSSQEDARPCSMLRRIGTSLGLKWPRPPAVGSYAAVTWTCIAHAHTVAHRNGRNRAKSEESAPQRDSLSHRNKCRG